MTKLDKLKKILKVLDPSKGTAVDFSQFNDAVDALKKGLEEKVQAQTLDDVNNQLDKFRKRIDLTPLLEAVANLETTLDVKIEGVTGLLSNEVSSLKKFLALQDESAGEQISTIASNIEVLKAELASLNNQKEVDITDIRKNLDNLERFNKKAETRYTEIQTEFATLKQGMADDEVEDDKEIQDLTDKLEALRKDLMKRIGNIGGGAMNRQNYIGNVDPLTRYTDINWKAGSNVTITYVNNDTTKRVDITIAATGGGGGTVRSINSISTPQTAGATAGTDYVYICTSALTLTMPTAVGNQNLYTIKNTSTGTVTIATTASQTIDGNLTITMPVQYTAVDLISDTAGWNVT